MKQHELSIELVTILHLYLSLAYLRKYLLIVLVSAGVGCDFKVDTV